MAYIIIVFEDKDVGWLDIPMRYILFLKYEQYFDEACSLVNNKLLGSCWFPHLDYLF